mgnify:FL=1
MGKLKEKRDAFENEVGCYGETIKRGIYAAIDFAVFLICGVIVYVSIPFTGFTPVLLIDFVLSAIALIGFVKFAINGLLFLKNGIEDILRIPGEAMQRAKEEKVQKEREQERKASEEAEAQLQAEIDAKAAPYKEMAENGDIAAIKKMAKIYYENGKEATAIGWYRRAVRSGDIEAQLTFAREYKTIGVSEAKKWLSEVQNNPKATPAQKEAARVKKMDIEQYESRQRIKESWRKEAGAVIEQQKQLPITGDFYVMRPYNRECANVGKACTYCARRTWHGRNWGTGINCGYNK